MSFSALISANSILNLYIQLPSDEEVGFNNTQWVQIAFALVVAYRHTVAASKPDQTAALLDTLSKLRSRVEALSTSDVDMNGARDVFFNFRNRVVRIQDWFGAHDRLEVHSRSAQSLKIIQNPPYLEPTQFDGFMGVAQHQDAALGDSFLPSAEDLQVPHDFLFASSFEQFMGDWV
jgi:hypothetical protein